MYVSFLGSLLAIALLRFADALVLCVSDVECGSGGSPSYPGCLTPLMCRQCNYQEANAADNGLQECDDAGELTFCNGDSRCGVMPSDSSDETDDDLEASEFKSRRNFQIQNNCEFPVWVGMNGKDPDTSEFIRDNGVPSGGGWHMASGETRTINIPNIFAGNIWARTNCGYEDGYSDSFEPFMCDSGECWASFNDFGKDGACCGEDDYGNYICAGPSAPTSMAEFTLANNEWSNDFYDVSLVDGYGIPVSFAPIEGSYILSETINYAGLGSNGCGDAQVNAFDAEANCPDMLRIDGTATKDASEDFDYTTLKYCRSICKSVDDPFQTNEMLIKWKTESDASDVLDEFYSDQDILDTHRGKSLLDLLCCQCGAGGGGCYEEDKSCNNGCSPFLDNDYLDPIVWTASRDAYDSRVCPNWGLTTQGGGTDHAMPLWPLLEDPSGQMINPAYLYRDTSPNAYSWQFDDISATFQCRNADYKITFCQAGSGAFENDETSAVDAQGLAGLLAAIMILLMYMV